jgi:hypothetical protein
VYEYLFIIEQLGKSQTAAGKRGKAEGEEEGANIYTVYVYIYNLLELYIQHTTRIHTSATQNRDRPLYVQPGTVEYSTDSSPIPGAFYTYFYNHTRRLRLEKLLYYIYVELARSSNGFF